MTLNALCKEIELLTKNIYNGKSYGFAMDDFKKAPHPTSFNSHLM